MEHTAEELGIKTTPELSEKINSFGRTFGGVLSGYLIGQYRGLIPIDAILQFSNAAVDLCLGLAGWAFVQLVSYIRVKRVAHEKAKLKAQVVVLSKKNDHLEEKVENLKAQVP